MARALHAFKAGRYLQPTNQANFYPCCVKYPLSSRRRCSNSVVPSPWSGFCSSRFPSRATGPLSVTRSRADRGGHGCQEDTRKPQGADGPSPLLVPGWCIIISGIARYPRLLRAFGLDRSSRGHVLCHSFWQPAAPRLSLQQLRNQSSASSFLPFFPIPAYSITALPLRSAFLPWTPNELPARLCRRWQAVFVRKRLDLPPHQTSSPASPPIK